MSSTKSSWLPNPAGGEFPLSNLPYGAFISARNPTTPHLAVAIGEYALDLHEATALGLLSDATLLLPTLNAFMAQAPSAWSVTRQQIHALLCEGGNDALRTNDDYRKRCLLPLSEVTLRMPCAIGDYTDFYSSKNHAYNVGVMFRGPANALQPNYLHLPVGYHGRASTVVVTGTDVRRPMGQVTPDDNTPPTHGPCRLLDFELEVGCFVGGPANELGRPLTMAEARERLFGLVVMNDWSARDIQRWEYVPLGPFTAKNFATTISPWIVPFEALASRKTASIPQDPKPLDYLTDSSEAAYDIELVVELKSKTMTDYTVISRSNTKYLYWSFAQQLCHHSVTGCVMVAGDLLGSGTISGPAEHEYGSMLELSWKGSKEIKISDTEVRKFLQDGDTVRMTARAGSVGFGECTGTVLPVYQTQ